MYFALFLLPWVLMYALSTLAMNHAWSRPNGGPPRFEKERELVYDGTFLDGAPPQQMARQILAHLELDGAHGVTRAAEDGSIVINRFDLIAPRRITYTPSDHRLVIERLPFRMSPFLERFHRRRGYAQPYALDDSWAFSVDLVIVAMCFWLLSGLWMWWELKVTRRLGALCLTAGVAVFFLFLRAL